MKRRKSPPGFSPETHAVIDGRATDVNGVVRCERCGEHTSDLEHHHRRPRGMGSTNRPESNLAANGGCLCGSCHRFCESFRTTAFEEGWLVRQSQTPSDIPVLRRGVWVTFRDSGSIIPVTTPPVKLEAVSNEDGMPAGITRLPGSCPTGCGDTLESDDDSGRIECCVCDWGLG